MNRWLFILLQGVLFECIVVFVFIQQSLKPCFISKYSVNFCPYPFTILASFQIEREFIKYKSKLFLLFLWVRFYDY